ncbi:MAG: hypothetical protein KatS3mg111_1298 [Pirellulaceae bacterium]|nr:MAG: hypothetical protein KatS3mg111_1298 [Pirellulaceae bacterium]
MRKFNKIFVIALPRCATVSMWQALGMLGVPTAHLGKLFGEASVDHHHAARLIDMYRRIERGDYRLPLLEHCRGLADYPACSWQVLEKLDREYPGSLFINVRRDDSVQRWLQSVERQFVGLQLIKEGHAASPEDRAFMQAMRGFRRLTFGDAEFDAERYRQAYLEYQQRVDAYFSQRASDLLTFQSTEMLDECGYRRLAEFLNCPAPDDATFPRCNAHSILPSRAFLHALESGLVRSQTGIRPQEMLQEEG